MSLRVLFAAGEALPFSKTGGLADVACALPAALAGLDPNLDLRLLTPAYPGALQRLHGPRRIAQLEVRGQPFTIWEGCVETGGVRVWLVDYPPLYQRPGTPYADPQGLDYGDNAWRFGCFSEVIARLAAGAADDGWRPDVVHLNDWHTGLAAVWIKRMPAPPALVFTIHNLAYQGLFPRREFDALGLPAELWHPGAVEFHGGFSFMKAALQMADAITTVSPGYAREIQTPAFGERLDGVMRDRAAILHGLVNGIDAQAWNPASDPLLAARCYTVDSVAAGKRANKRALQQQLGLAPLGDAPLLGFIGRLAQQKGADLLLGAAGWLRDQGVQLALLGSGDRYLEQAFGQLAAQAPGSVAVHIGYDEPLAHRIEAGADFFVMPSRFEPCGLNQMYSQRYGTIPVVRKTGGLADTVIDATPENLAAGVATGVHFEHADSGGIHYGLGRALALYRQPRLWRAMQRRGMRQDFSWTTAAASYRELYLRLRPG